VEKGEIPMKKESRVVIICLMLSMMLSMMPMVMRASAVPVIGPNSPTPEIEWIDYPSYQGLAWNPEYLKLKTGATGAQFITNTTITVQGKDTYLQNIEAKVLLNGTKSKKIPREAQFILNDTHTDPPMPVAFATITGIFQQNGTHSNSVEIRTSPEPFEEYLGQYHGGGDWQDMATAKRSPNRMFLSSHPTQIQSKSA
jgi:hypothetical protein